MLGYLSKKYESNGAPGCISDGWGDSGGKSYGAYQLSSAMGSVHSYLGWLKREGYWFADNLLEHEVGSEGFDRVWEELGSGANRADFYQSQHDYIKEVYYDEAVILLKRAMFNAKRHTNILQDVIWSAAVQYGSGNVVELFETACRILGYPNLSYVDAANFDLGLIENIYQVRATEEWTSGAPALRAGLYHRFRTEGAEAMEACKKELGLE